MASIQQSKSRSDIRFVTLIIYNLCDINCTHVLLLGIRSIVVLMTSGLSFDIGGDLVFSIVVLLDVEEIFLDMFVILTEKSVHHDNKQVVL